MTKYPFYFEVIYSNDGEPDVEEGGFITAEDYEDATKQIVSLYEPGMLSMKIECLDDIALTFTLTKARQAKEYVEANHV